MKINPLKKRILEICFKNKISHIGSAITAVDIIDEIYSQKRGDDIFILSSGHAGIALYVVLEKYYGFDAEELYKKHGLHPHMDFKNKIYCSTGSLGMGITVAVGAAIADRSKGVYVLCSDGEMAEGSFWESMYFLKEEQLDNIFIYVNLNGYAAYKKVSLDKDFLLDSFGMYNNVIVKFTGHEEIPFLKGLQAHYYVMSEDDWNFVKDL